MGRAIISLALVFSCLQLWAQKNTLSGIVYDYNTGETLIGATVVVQGASKLGAATDINGFFSLPGITENDIDITISFIGYTSKKLKINFNSKKNIFKEVKLKPQPIELGQVNIIELSSDMVVDREIETSQHRLSPKTIKSIPTARNDVFRAIRFLPGIEATEPLSPLVSVRGSDPAENLIMLDGVTIYNPYHFISSSGIFNMQTVKNIDILVGGFGAEYGGRNSSVIHISTKDGNKNGIHGEIHPSTVESNVFVEFPLNKKTTMMVAGRLNYDIISNFIMQSNNYFYDVNLSVTHRINSRNRIDIKYFGSKDHTSMDINTFYKYLGNSMYRLGDTIMSDIFNNMNFTWQNQWRNNIGTVIWKSVISPKLFIRVQSYLSLHNANNFTLLKMKFEDVKFNTSTRFKSKVNDYTVKASLNYKPFYWTKLKVGAEYNKYLFLNESQINGIDGAKAKAEPQLLSIFAEDKIKLGKLTVRPGVRLSNFESRGYEVEPRINMALSVNKGLKFKAAYGKYYQYIISMNTQDLEFNQFLDYYYPLIKSKPSISYHYIIGVEKRINKNHKLTADVYYKKIDRTYIFNMMQSRFEAFAFSDKIVEGWGESYGIELLWKGQYKRFSGWCSYTLSRSTRSFPNIMDGKLYLYDYDHKHNIKGVVNFQATKRISYSADFMFQSGVPRSVENSLQMFYMYEPVTGQMYYSPQYTIDQKNSSRMPWIMSINLGMEKRIVKGFGKDISDFFNAEESYLVISIRNILFLRRNVNYYLPMIGFDKYIPIGMNYLPAVSAGYTIKF